MRDRTQLNSVEDGETSFVSPGHQTLGVNRQYTSTIAGVTCRPLAGARRGAWLVEPVPPPPLIPSVGPAKNR